MTPLWGLVSLNRVFQRDEEQMSRNVFYTAIPGGCAAVRASALSRGITGRPLRRAGFPESANGKKSLNYFAKAPKDWPNSVEEFFLDNLSSAWDITRDFLGGGSARKKRTYRMNNLIVN